MTPRPDGRAPDQLRPVRFTPHWQRGPAGSVLIECGQTRVACAVSVEAKVPPFLEGTGKGWLTAEYGMLPGSGDRRVPRPVAKQDGRAVEIQRLIGRSLRAMVDLDRLGPLTLTVDCDVIEADGGTRTAAITGAAVAVVLALDRLHREGRIPGPVVVGQLPGAGAPWVSPLRGLVAAVSVGRVDGTLLLDLPYAEDRRAEVDANVVMTAAGQLIEFQATAEQGTYSRAELDALTDLAAGGIRQLVAAQQAALQAEGLTILVGD
jgi:ribonuclease PH